VTTLAVILCLSCQLFLVIGQLLLKHGMNTLGAAHDHRRRKGLGLLSAGVTCLAAWFFVWVGLLQKWELTRVFPFEGLNPAMLAIAAFVFLHERITAAGWLGIGLITAGLALVTGS
jgi:uncharacterized membrane protein